MAPSEQIALLIAGVVAPFITQYLKYLLNTQDRLAHALSIAVAVVIAAVALLLTGGLSFEQPEGFILKLGGVFALAQIVYRQLLKDDTGTEG